MVHFGEFLKTRSLWSNSVPRQVSFKNSTNIGGKCLNSKFLSNFQTMCRPVRRGILSHFVAILGMILTVLVISEQLLKGGITLKLSMHFL